MARFAASPRPKPGRQAERSASRAWPRRRMCHSALYLAHSFARRLAYPAGAARCANLLPCQDPSQYDFVTLKPPPASGTAALRNRTFAQGMNRYAAGPGTGWLPQSRQGRNVSARRILDHPFARFQPRGISNIESARAIGERDPFAACYLPAHGVAVVRIVIVISHYNPEQEYATFGIAMRIVLAVVLAGSSSLAQPQPKVNYPGTEWQSHSRTGWSEPMLKVAREFTSKQKTAAVVIVQHGLVVDQWGEVSKKIRVRSVRKSFLSALYGIQAAQGKIDLGKTIADLDIDDKQPLTASEKQASLIDLLRARSGVFHPAAYETPAMKAARPQRGSQRPGEFFYYNNWDFNTLGAIYEKLTGEKIFSAIEQRIAKPIGMQDFVAADGSYALSEESNYAAYDFRMTARDMARFGLLYLRNGVWTGRQVVPEAWVKRSTTAYSRPPGSGDFGAYGLLWWVGSTGFEARGNGGHVIAVLPAKDLVVVHRVDNDREANVVSYRDIETLIRIVTAAAGPETGH